MMKRELSTISVSVTPTSRHSIIATGDCGSGCGGGCGGGGDGGCNGGGGGGCGGH